MTQFCAVPAVRPFRPRDLLREALICEIALSPDGESVVYSRRTIEGNAYRTTLWRVPYRGGRAERLTAGESDTCPRFSPDGRTLLFLSSRSGTAQPWALPLAGGEAEQIAELQGGVEAAEWSPDGRQVLLLGPSGVERFRVGDPERALARRIDVLTWRLDGVGVRDQLTSAWLVPGAGGRPRRLTPPTGEVVHAFWLPDARVGFLADLRPEAEGVELPQAWAVGLVEKARPRLLARLAGQISSAAASPGGRVALIGVDRPEPVGFENPQVFVLAGRRLRVLGADLDRPACLLATGDLFDFRARRPPPLRWLGEDAVAALVTDRGCAHPYRFSLDGRVERLAGGPVVCFRLEAAAGRVVVAATERGRAAEVCAVEDGELRPLTRNGGRWLAPYRRDPERHRVRHRDGHEIDAWLLPGHGRRRRALVVHVHGGPHLAHSPTPWLEMLALASAGFSVLYGNPRGSPGYGESFSGSIAGDWGERDASDVMRLLDWAVRGGRADRDRVGLLGLSYGGYMTTWLLGRNPGRFRVAVAENPVTDLLGEFATCDLPYDALSALAGVRLPADDPARVFARSPLARVHVNEAPLLLLQAEADLRCPPGQSEAVFNVLRLLGRRVELVRYPEESHLLVFRGRPDRRVDRLERIVDRFERHL